MELVERAVLVGVYNRYYDEFLYSMEELRELAEACDVEFAGQVEQRLNRPSPSHYIGKGKIQEVARLLLEQDANVVIFNDELTPTQIRNLETELNCKVIDRTLLILDIFAERAKTKEAQLQVEMARLQYMLPRMVGLRASLSRQGGGSSFRNRGVGETKLELDRRIIEDKIAAVNKELESVVAHRQNQRKRRKKSGIPVVAFVGYTNAGKSTLINALVHSYSPHPTKTVFTKDMLFATLDTSVRKIVLPDHRSLLLTDTVGFVSKLPHHLVKAFRSTLEEVADADLLVHVVDISHPDYIRQMKITEETLKEIGIDGIPTIYVYNKADRTDNTYPVVVNDRVFLSAKKGVGLDKLMEMIAEEVFSDYIQCDMFIPYHKGYMTSYFNEHARIYSTRYEETGTLLTLECKLSDYKKFEEFVVSAKHS